MGECDTPEIWGSTPLNGQKGSGQVRREGYGNPYIYIPLWSVFFLPPQKSGLQAPLSRKTNKKSGVSGKTIKLYPIFFYFLTNPLIFAMFSFLFRVGSERGRIYFSEGVYLTLCLDTLRISQIQDD